MALTLDQFIAQQKKLLDDFADYWRDENSVNSKIFPLSMEDGNEGAWFEQFSQFGDGTDPDKGNKPE